MLGTQNMGKSLEVPSQVPGLVAVSQELEMAAEDLYLWMRASLLPHIEPEGKPCPEVPPPPFSKIRANLTATSLYLCQIRALFANEVIDQLN